jgi:hypothetical protein
MKTFIAFCALALALGCAVPDDPQKNETSKGDPAPTPGPAKGERAEDYARQANENAIKGEDMPENRAPDDPDRTGGQ